MSYSHQAAPPFHPAGALGVPARFFTCRQALAGFIRTGGVVLAGYGPGAPVLTRSRRTHGTDGGNA